MHFLCFGLFLFGKSSQLLSQEYGAQVDSLRLELQKDKVDSIHVDDLWEMAVLMHNYDYDSLLVYARQVFRLSREQNLRELRKRSAAAIIMAYRHPSRQDSMLIISRMILDTGRVNQEPDLIVQGAQKIATYYAYGGEANIDSIMFYYDLALEHVGRDSLLRGR